MPRPAVLRSRVAVYVAIRVVAALAFILAATVLPKGVPAAVVVVVAGLAAVMTCFGTNAGGPGERAGARPQDRWFDQQMAPQGDWPPYDVTSEQSAPPPEATSRRSAAS